MDARAIASLIVKTAGLLLLIHALALAPDRIAGYLMVGGGSLALLFGTVLFPVAVPLAVGAFLFSFPATAASAVVEKSPASSSDFDARLQVVIFSGIGLYVLLQGVITVVYYAALAAFLNDEYSTDSLVDPAAKANLASAVFSVALGAALSLGARGVSALLTRLRS